MSRCPKCGTEVELVSTNDAEWSECRIHGILNDADLVEEDDVEVI